MDTGLRNKSCLITGGNSGIGYGIAKVLAQEGVRLFIAARDEHEEEMRSLRSVQPDTQFLQVDVSSETAVVDMVQRAISACDGIDLFVNNAAGAWHEPVTRISADAFRKTIDTNLAACVWAGREISRHMISRRSGSILIVGSTVRVSPAYGEAAYRISKMGLKMYMETLAIELAPHKIRANMITPGHFPTRLTAGLKPEHEPKLKHEIPLRRFGEPSECGYAAAFLLSDRLSSFVTGADLVVDGGLSLRPLALISDEQITDLNS